VIFPWWLSAILAPLNVSPAIKLAVEGAYIIWLELPFLKKLWAMWHLRKAIHAAVKTDTPMPLARFQERFGATVGNAPAKMS
jgi:hypothetical protein